MVYPGSDDTANVCRPTGRRISWRSMGSRFHASIFNAGNFWLLLIRSSVRRIRIFRFAHDRLLAVVSNRSDGDGTLPQFERSCVVAHAGFDEPVHILLRNDRTDGKRSHDNRGIIRARSCSVPDRRCSENRRLVFRINFFSESG